MVILSNPETPRIQRSEPTCEPKLPRRLLNGRPTPHGIYRDHPKPRRSLREHVRELEATSREFEAARAARAESFCRSIENQERLARETHFAVLSASFKLALLFH